MTGSQRRPIYARVLSYALAIILFFAIAGVIAFILLPIPLEPGFTELALLGPNGTATEYPTNLSAGDSGAVTVVVENHEHREMNYTLSVRTESSMLASRTMTLEDDETWRDDITFTVPSEGTSRIEFALYRGRTSPAAPWEPYRLAYLTLNESNS